MKPVAKLLPLLRALLINESEGRVRALWRLLGHGLALVACWWLYAILVVSLGMSGEGGLGLRSTLVMGLAAVTATYLCARYLDRRPFEQLGLVLTPRWWADFGVGVVLGALLMGGVFVVELAAGWVEIRAYARGPAGLPLGPALLGALVMFVLVGFYEELVSRGYHLRNIAEGLDELGLLRGRPRLALALAVLGSSAVFGLLHAGNPNATALSTFNVTLAGLMLAAGVLWTGQLGIAAGLHLSWNFCQGNVFGFPVSGSDAGARLIALDQGGDPLITGGDFGPEAGLIGVAAMLAGVGLQALWVRLSRGELRLAPGLARFDTQ